MSYIIPSSEFLIYQPSFVTPPFVLNKSYNNITIRTRLDNYGFIYAVATERNSEEGRSGERMSALLIQKGLDSQARRVPSSSVEVSIPYELYDITIRDLKNSTDYT